MEEENRSLKADLKKLKDELDINKQSEHCPQVSPAPESLEAPAVATAPLSALGLRSWVRANGLLLVPLLGSVVRCLSGGLGSPRCSETNSGASRPGLGPGSSALRRWRRHQGLWGGDRKNLGSYTRLLAVFPKNLL